MPPTFSSKPLPFSGKTSTAIPHWNELQYNSTISYTRRKKYIQTLVSMEFYCIWNHKTKLKESRWQHKYSR